MRKSLFQSSCVLVVSLAFGFFAIHQSLKTQEQQGRMPQSSVNQIYKMLTQIENDLNDPQLFNRDTAISYIKNLTESAYNLDTKDIYPNTPEEQAYFAETRVDWMKKLFNIQNLLRKKMFAFHSQSPLNQLQIAAFRNGNMYLSYAQDFVLMEWSQSQDLNPHQKMFSADFPITLKNPELQNFNLQPGDVILVRGGSFVSATIARSGDYLSNYSHVAMVVQDPQGSLSVAEALMEEGLIVYTLDKYLSLEKLSRAMVLRPKNTQDGKAAALEGFKIIDADLKSPVKKMFDMLMNPDQHDKIYCFELVRMAYLRATNGKINLPTFPMSFKKSLAGNSFYRGLGNKLEVGAAPDDVFFQPEFDIVMIQRDVSQLKKDWAFDVAMSSIFEFIKDSYEYKKNVKTSLIATLAHFLKNDLKIDIKKIPPGITSEAVELILLHKSIATDLQTHLMQAMNSSPKPMAYKDLEQKAKMYLESNKEKYFAPCSTSDNTKNCKQILK